MLKKPEGKQLCVALWEAASACYASGTSWSSGHYNFMFINEKVSQVSLLSIGIAPVGLELQVHFHDGQGGVMDVTLHDEISHHQLCTFIKQSMIVEDETFSEADVKARVYPILQCVLAIIECRAFNEPRKGNPTDMLPPSMSHLWTVSY